MVMIYTYTMYLYKCYDDTHDSYMLIKYKKVLNKFKSFKMWIKVKEQLVNEQRFYIYILWFYIYSQMFLSFYQGLLLYMVVITYIPMKMK